MDEAMMAAIADEPGRAAGDEDRFGLASPDDKAFLYRALASLCGAGLTLRQAVDRVVSTLAEPVGDANEAARASHFAGRLGTALDAPPGTAGWPGPAVPGGDTFNGILERSGFLLHDVERCMFSFRLDEVGNGGVAAAFDRGLSCITSMQARVAESARARATR